MISKLKNDESLSNYSLESIDNYNSALNYRVNNDSSSESYIAIDSANSSTTDLIENIPTELPIVAPHLQEESENLSVSETFRLSAIFSFIWFLSNYFQNASLSLTNVSSSTILVLCSYIHISINMCIHEIYFYFIFIIFFFFYKGSLC